MKIIQKIFCAVYEVIYIMVSKIQSYKDKEEASVCQTKKEVAARANWKWQDIAVEKS